MSSGALSATSATESVYHTGLKHLHEPLWLALLQNIYGAILLSTSGCLALTIATGISGAEEGNAALPRLLQGLLFPIGLIIIYLVDAHLYTGYPLYFALTTLARQGKPLAYLTHIVVGYIGNLIGAALVAFFFSFATGTLTSEPYRSGVVNQITEDILNQPFYAILLRSIGCGFLVTQAMFLGTQNHDGISKALGLHLPFFCRHGV